MGRRFFLIASAAALVAALTPAGRAQPSSALAIEILEQPVWHGPGDRLGLTIRLANAGPDPVAGYIVTVAAHGRVLNRSELHASFDQPATFEASKFQAATSPETEIAPGSSVDVVIDDPVSELQSIAVTSEAGVYPLTITAFDSTGALLATASTQLLYYPTRPEFRLPTIPILPIAGLPRRGPDGSFTQTDDTFPLDEAVITGGWLRGLVTSLERATSPPPETPDRSRRRRRGRPSPQPQPLHLGVAVMPRLAEELADMADGYRRGDERVPSASPISEAASDVLSDIQTISGRTGVQEVLSPYSFADLPTLFDLLDDDATARDHMKDQITEAEVVLTDTLGEAPPRTWLYSPGARLDLASLEGLQSLDAARFSFFAEESLEPLEDPAGGGCPEPPLSFTCAVTVATGEGRVTGFLLDREVQARAGGLASDPNDRVSIQRFFAELAMIKEELPSRVDRIIAFALPGVWHPRPSTTRLLLEGLRDAPFLQTLTPEEGLTALTSEAEPFDRRIRSVIPRLANAPDETYADEVDRTDRIVGSFRGLQPPPTLLDRLERNLLTSESRFWWNEPARLVEGERYAVDAGDEAQGELSKISIGGTDEISLTSSEAQLPVIVFNDASYDVSVTVNVRSTDLRLDESFSETVQANGLRQLTVDITAQSSGIFQAFVEIETPDGHHITEKQITVRSTAFNEIALGLTFGALAFLILFYITRAIRTRRTAQEETQ